LRQTASSLAEPVTMADATPAFAKSVLALLGKDVRCELRSRHAVTAMLLFALTSTVAVAATIGRTGLEPDVAAGLLWIVIYFSAMSGLSRSFVREEEGGTSPLLKLALSPNAVYLGKLAFNLGLLLAIEIVVVPVFVGLTNCRIGNWPGLIGILVLGSLGLSAAGTLAAAMVARATVKGALYAVICFPLLAPVLFAAVSGSQAAIGGTIPGSNMRLLLYYFGTVITASLLLFRFVWED
jgi:heme exporter protein B